MTNQTPSIRHKILLLVGAAGLLLTAPAAIGDDSDLFASKMPPNVMLVVDNSLSMVSSIFHPAYDPDTSYKGSCSDFDSYSGPWNLSAGPSSGDFNSGVDVTYCSRTRKVPGLDTNHDGVDDAEMGYYPNYLYWFFSDAVMQNYDIDGDGSMDGTIYDQIWNYSKSYSGCRTTGSYLVYHRDRATSARQILEEVLCQVNRNGKIRFGLANFRHTNRPNGGYVRVPIDDATWDHDADPMTAEVDRSYALNGATRTHLDHLYDAFSTFSVDSSTPLGETLFQVYTYFMSRTAADLPYGDSNKDGTPDTGAGRFPVYQYVTDPSADYGGRNVSSASGWSVPPCPVQEWCQKNFVILITDGEPIRDDFVAETGGSHGTTGVGFNNFMNLIGNYKDNVGTATAQCTNTHECRYLDDIAKFMQDHDFLPNNTLFKGQQKIDVYTLGFATNAALNAFLQSTADAGGGSFNSSGDPDALSTAVIDALQDIIEKSQVFTAPTVPASRSSSGNNFYLSYFKPADKGAFWEGHLKLYDINVAGEIRDKFGVCIFRDPANPATIRCDGGLIQLDQDGFWDAQDEMPLALSRNLLVSKYQSGPPPTTPATLTAFDEANVDEIDLGLNFAELPLYANVGNGTAGMANVTDLKNGVIRFVQGCEFGSGACIDRSKRLSDIFHSSPLPVGPPNSPIPNVGYQKFAENYAYRTKVIYVGTNGGFLHGFHTGAWQATPAPGGFDRGTGVELFGFMPYPARQNIKHLPTDLSPRDYYYVDGSPSVSDAWFYPSESSVPGGIADWTSWHSVLVGGMRQGGEVIYALDVTDPPSASQPAGLQPALPYPAYLWEFPCEDQTDPICTGSGTYEYSEYMGETWSQPIITKIKMAPTACTGTCPSYLERWVAIFGAGYHETGDPNEPTGAAYDASLAATTSRKGRALFMLDVKTGKVLGMKRFDTNTSQGEPTMRYALASAPAVFDVDYDGFADVVYIGDLGGQVWKWVIHAPAEDTISVGATGDVLQPQWYFKRFFEAQPCPAATCGTLRTKSFFYPPSGTVLRGNLYLAFGSGERADLDYIGTQNEEKNRYYVVKDVDPMVKMAPPVPPAPPLSDPRHSDAPGGGVMDVSYYSGSCVQPTGSEVGFYFEAEQGEKFITDSAIFAGGVLTGSFVPSSIASGCEAAGDGYLYYFDLFCGKGKWDDPNSSDPNDTIVRKSVGKGPPTSPKVSMGPLENQGDGSPCGNMVFDFSSDGGALAEGADCMPSSGVRTKSWRDLD